MAMDWDVLREKAGQEKFDGDEVRYLRDVVCTGQALDLLKMNEEQFGALEKPEVADLKRDPAAREARVNELRETINAAQQELNQLDELAVDARTPGQVPLNPDGSVANLHGDDTAETREARYRSMNNDALRAEIERRNNDGRDDADRMAVSGNKDALVDRLIEDDEWAAELAAEEGAPAPAQ